MYTTTNKLEQSKSVERLKENRDIENMSSPFEKKIASYKPRTKVRTNMTSMENDLGAHINKIYKEKLGMGSSSGVQSINSECKPKNPGKKHFADENKSIEGKPPSTPKRKKMYGNGYSRNNGLERCVTAPTLHTLAQLDRETREVNEIPSKGTQLKGTPSKKPPMIPCRQRSN